MNILDLFCGEGGATSGYGAAGHNVVGVDNSEEALSRYPGFSLRLDIMKEFPMHLIQSADLVHASPPEEPVIIDYVFERLLNCGKPWILEDNRKRIPGGRIQQMCIARWGVPTHLHRSFAVSDELLYLADHAETWGAPCPGGPNHITPVKDPEVWRNWLRLEWMSIDGASNACPPAYTMWMGHHLKQ